MSDIERQFEELARAFGPPIERLAMGYEANAEKRAELVQDIYLNLWRALPSFREESSTRTWLYRIAHNVAITYVAKEARGRSTAHVDGDSSPASTPDAAAVTNQRLGQLYDAVRAMDRVDQQMIMLYLEELTAREIGEVMGMPVSSVTTRISRLKARLRNSVGGSDE